MQQIPNPNEIPNPSAHTAHVQSTTATISTNTRRQVMLQTATAIATNEDGSKSARMKSYLTVEVSAPILLMV